MSVLVGDTVSFVFRGKKHLGIVRSRGDETVTIVFRESDPWMGSAKALVIRRINEVKLVRKGTGHMRDPSRRPKRRFALHGADTNYVYGLFVKNRSGGAWHQKALFKTKEEAHRFRFHNGYQAYSKKLPDRGVKPSPWRISKVRIEDLPFSEYNLFKSRDPSRLRRRVKRSPRHMDTESRYYNVGGLAYFRGPHDEYQIIGYPQKGARRLPYVFLTVMTMRQALRELDYLKTEYPPDRFVFTIRKKTVGLTRHESGRYREAERLKQLTRLNKKTKKVR